MTKGVVIQPFVKEMAEAAGGMTFPAYRHLLSLEVQPRHPEQGDTRLVQPIAFVATKGQVILGLALAELSDAPQKSAEILSVLVDPAGRGQGIATALVEKIEQEVKGRGCPEIKAVYMTGKPGIAVMERIFWKRGFQAPQARTVTLRFTPEEALATPWFSRVKLGSAFSVFPWKDLPPEERQSLVESNAKTPWVAPGLEAWRHDRQFDPVSSLGLRRNGQVVGWVINHQVAPDVVRFTCSYMGYGLGRRGRIMPLYTQSLERLRGTSVRYCTFVTPVTYVTMVEFVKKRCAPWASFFGETRGVTKKLP
jgi:GNAT superfamily N-acetyltransferase